MVKLKKFRLGALYKIRFYDHSVGSTDKMLCEAVGWAIKDDSHHIALTSWMTITTDEDIKNNNFEPISIIKACILSSRKLL